MTPGSVIDTSDIRRQYARSICDAAGTSNSRVRAAFAAVPREAFLGPGPWRVFDGGGEPTTTRDVQLIYQDVLISLAPDRRINNGQPSLHAMAIAAVDPRPGETIVHIGAGTGYYTAILAELAGPTGRVQAFEIEPDLAAMALQCLKPWPQVQLQAATGCTALETTDVVYVSAAVSDPAPEWLDALPRGGRLLCPLAPGNGHGGMLLATRLDPHTYTASFLCRASFIPCVGAQSRSSEASAALAEAFADRDPREVRSLRRGDPPDGSAWYVGDGWWLSTAETSAP
jgi:protein-L-isoaspartate(D-aspartate) O-methyltransferase